MVSSTNSEFVIGILGSILSFVSFLSPLPTFGQILRQESVQQYSAAPYLSNLANCMCWFFNGLLMLKVPPKTVLPVIINGLGAVISSAYVIIFGIHSDKRKRLRVVRAVVIELVFMTILTVLVLTLTHDTKKRTQIVGITSASLNIMMQASPFCALKLLITTKSVEYMPFLPAVTSLARCIVWVVYAHIQSNLYILIPNAVGIFCAAVQLILYGFYYQSTRNQMAAATQEVNGEVDLPEIIVK